MARSLARENHFRISEKMNTVDVRHTRKTRSVKKKKRKTGTWTFPPKCKFLGSFPLSSFCLRSPAPLPNTSNTMDNTKCTSSCSSIYWVSHCIIAGCATRPCVTPWKKFCHWTATSKGDTTSTIYCTGGSTTISSEKLWCYILHRNLISTGY